MSRHAPEGTRADYDKRRYRTMPWRRLYNTPEWARLRKEVLTREPICRMCKRRPSSVADHVHRHNGCEVKFFAGPFQALCKQCHDGAKQRQEKTRRPAIGPDGWPVKG